MIHKMSKEKKKKMAERFLAHALEIIYLLTGEEYTIVKKNSPQKRIRKLKGEVPIKCDDVAAYFSMDEWDYVEGHKGNNQDMMENDQEEKILEIPANMSLEMESLTDDDMKTEIISAKGKHEMNIQLVEIHSDSCSEFEDENVDSTIDKYEKNKKDLQQLETHLDLCRDNLNADIVPNVEQIEESCVGIQLESREHQFQDNICTEVNDQNLYTGSISEEESEKSEKYIKQEEFYPDCWAGDTERTSGIFSDHAWRPDVSPNMKPSTVSATECPVENFVDGCLKIEVEEVAIGIGIDEAMDGNSYGQYQKSCEPVHSLKGDMSRFKSQETNNINRNPKYSNSERFEVKGLNPYVDGSLSKPYTSTNTDTEGNSMQLITVRNESRRATRGLEMSMNVKKNNYGKCNTNSLSYNSQFTPQRTRAGDKKYTCFECGKSFVQRSQFVVHQRTHTGEKPFVCTECFKSFRQKSHLVRHQRFHTGEKPFECAVCGKRFSQKSHFVIHQRIHTGEKPFGCSICGRRFISKSLLVTHQKIHPEEKTFLCTICNYSYRDRASLVRHQRIHTGGKPFTLC